MKRLQDMTRDELLLLNESPEDFQKLVDLEAAFAQIEFVSMPTEIVELPEPPKSVEVHEVSSFYVTSHEFIEDLRALFSKHGNPFVSVSYDWNDNLRITYAKPDREAPIITTKSVSSENERKAFLAEHSELAKKKEAWDKEQERFESYIVEISRVRATIYDAIAKAQKAKKREEQVWAIWQHYVELADGGIETAEKFFRANQKEADIAILEVVILSKNTEAQKQFEQEANAPIYAQTTGLETKSVGEK